MNINYLLRTIIPVTVMLSIATVSSAIAESVVTLNDCLELEFRNGEMTPKSALETGECYLNLVTQTMTKDGLADKRPGKIYSVHTVSEYSDSTFLQYADSWFQLAAEGEHPLARQRIGEVRQLLNAAKQSK